MSESGDLSLVLQIFSVAIGWSRYFGQWDLDLFPLQFSFDFLIIEDNLSKLPSLN